MRFTAFCGCLVTAIDCAQWAGKQAGGASVDSFAWAYWIFAIVWIFAGFRILFVGTEA